MNRQIKDTADPVGILPWYRQFWPWFIIALPATVVVAGLATVFIAFRYADSMVDDDYFREGLAINRRMEQEQVAAQLGLQARLDWDIKTGEIMLALSTLQDASDIALPEQLALQLFHPAEQAADKVLMMNQVVPGFYRADLQKPLYQRYYLRLTPMPGSEWRLAGEMDFTNQASITLGQ